MYSHDVLCLHFYANNVIELNDISETLEIGNNLSSSNSTRVVVWVEKYVKITKETREYAQYNMRELKYEAQVFPSLANKIVFNLFIKLRKNNHPLKA